MPDFRQDLAYADGVAAKADLESVLLQTIPGAVLAERATPTEDKAGTDYWVTLSSGRILSVDLKVRRKDPQESFGSNDVALEIWSDVERRIVGWTLDTGKRTDYVMWYFEPTGRWMLFPFPMLCQAFQSHGKKWCATYRQATQSNGTWTSRCVFVPVTEVWGAITTLSTGVGE